MQRIIDITPDALRKGRNIALIAMDMSWGRAMFPGAPDADIEIAMHKARYHSTDLPRNVRHQSAQWLRERGHADVLGEPVMAEGMLPR